MQAPKTSIITVAFNETRKLSRCLSSLKKLHSVEIIVVDNSEKDVGVEKLCTKMQVKYIGGHGNIGFGAANNLGVKNSNKKTDYLLFVNPDTKISLTAYAQLIGVANIAFEYAAFSPLLFNETRNDIRQVGLTSLTPINSIFILSFLNKYFPHNPFSKNYFNPNNYDGGLIETMALPGSCFMIRREVFEEVSGFDEGFFLYFEEHDLGMRLSKLGYKMAIVPSAKVYHEWKALTPESKKIARIFAQSRFRYFKKHFGYFNALLVEFFARISPKKIALFVLYILFATLLIYVWKN